MDKAKHQASDEQMRTAQDLHWKNQYTVVLLWLVLLILLFSWITHHFNVSS